MQSDGSADEGDTLKQSQQVEDDLWTLFEFHDAQELPKKPSGDIEFFLPLRSCPAARNCS